MRRLQTIEDGRLNGQRAIGVGTPLEVRIRIDEGFDVELQVTSSHILIDAFLDHFIRNELETFRRWTEDAVN